MSVITRFAPSPTGHLHLGSAYSAFFAERCAREAGGRFLIRIEDIDRERCRDLYAQAIFEDLAWLGLRWETPVRYQSAHFDDYINACARLDALQLLYPCFCSRREIRAEIRAAGYAPHAAPAGPEGPVYPGTCRDLSPAERQQRIASGASYALRLDTTRALAQTGPLTWFDRSRGEQPVNLEKLGDVVLARKDSPTSYHLSVTVDDHLQGITLVTRGDDLFAVTPLHRLLQALLGYNTPEYLHHGLRTGPEGQRYSKRDKSLSIRYLRESGLSPRQVQEMAHADL
ncbi:MAG: tRNA glutamyl-Q(34) synthetase GluQRS [Rhodospirillales bacterium]|nr:tRNA glutamyl-Q(34) synthetase GluQRS [Rhodospirillales bacterium]